MLVATFTIGTICAFLHVLSVQGQETCYVIPNTSKRMIGGNYFEPDVASQEECEDECTADSTCLGISYDASTTECLLYDQSPATNPDDYATKPSQSDPDWYLKVACKTGSCGYSQPDPSKVLIGTVRAQPTVTSLSECEDACTNAASFNCRSLRFTPATSDADAECLLYESDSSVSPDLFVPKDDQDSNSQYYERNACSSTTSTPSTSASTSASTSTPSTTSSSTSSTGSSSSSTTTSAPTSTTSSSNGLCFNQVPGKLNYRLDDSVIKGYIFAVESLNNCEQMCRNERSYTCKAFAYFPSDKECAQFMITSSESPNNFKEKPPSDGEMIYKELGTCGTAPPAGSCEDKYHLCAFWAYYDQCRTNPGYMFIFCQASCGVCPGVPAVPVGIPSGQTPYGTGASANGAYGQSQAVPYGQGQSSNLGYGQQSVTNAAYGQQQTQYGVQQYAANAQSQYGQARVSQPAYVQQQRAPLYGQGQSSNLAYGQRSVASAATSYH